MLCCTLPNDRGNGNGEEVAIEVEDEAANEEQ